ncbi:hypothetical protein GCM10010524_32620 [Streptomyces mexicanus]
MKGRAGRGAEDMDTIVAHGAVVHRAQRIDVHRAQGIDVRRTQDRRAPRAGVVVRPPRVSFPAATTAAPIARAPRSG